MGTFIPLTNQIRNNYFKDMSGKKSALEAPKTGVSEDDRGRKTWDRKEFSVMAENRLKK